MKKKLCRITALLLAAVLSLGGCGQPGAGKKRTDSTQQTEETKNKKEDQSKSDKKGPEIDGLTYESTMDLTYATEFDVYDYKDGYKLLDVPCCAGRERSSGRIVGGYCSPAAAVGSYLYGSNSNHVAVGCSGCH